MLFVITLTSHCHSYSFIILDGHDFVDILWLRDVAGSQDGQKERVAMVLLILLVDGRTVFRRCNFQTPPVCLYFSRCGTFADASPRQTASDSKNQDVFPGIGDTPGLPDFDIPGLPGIGDTLPNKDLQSLVPDIPRLLGVPSAKCHSALFCTGARWNVSASFFRTASSVASTQDLPSEDEMNTPEVPGPSCHPVPIDGTWRVAPLGISGDLSG